LTRFIAKGPTDRELKRIKTQFYSSFVRGIERIGGFGGKSDALAMNEVYGGRPDFYKVTLDRAAKATAGEIRTASEQWLSDGVYVLEVHPFPKHKTIASNVDRSSVPEAGPPPDAKFPQMQRMTLSNGLQVILAEHHAIPVVNFHLLIDAGFAADQDGIPGLSSLTMEMMDEGTKHRSALEISEELAMLGATLRTGSSLDMSNVRFSALKENLTDSLDILADVILNPSFPETDFQRLKRERLVQIKQEMVRPNLMALRALPRILYGKDHAYGNSFTGSGTEESVARITRDDLVEFHRTWVQPNNATLVVTGDTTLEELKPELERQFGVWQRGETPRKDIETVAFKSGSTCVRTNTGPMALAAACPTREASDRSSFQWQCRTTKRRNRWWKFTRNSTVCSGAVRSPTTNSMRPRPSEHLLCPAGGRPAMPLLQYQSDRCERQRGTGLGTETEQRLEHFNSMVWMDCVGIEFVLNPPVVVKG
jgi:zinc protease